MTNKIREIQIIIYDPTALLSVFPRISCVISQIDAAKIPTNEWKRSKLHNLEFFIPAAPVDPTPSVIFFLSASLSPNKKTAKRFTKIGFSF